MRKQISLKVVLHLGEELRELLADFLPDLCLNERVLCLLLLKLELQLPQQRHLLLSKKTPALTELFYSNTYSTVT